MPSNKAFQLVIRLSEAVILEEELFEETDAHYATEFTLDFRDEEDYIREMNITQNHLDVKKNIEPSPIKKSLLKTMYRKLAAKTHPDVTNGKDEDFKIILKAFESEDGPALLAASLSHGIDVSIEAADIKAMMSDINRRRNQIDSRKNTFRWAWGESKKDGKAKEYIRAALQIDETAFLEWLKTRS